MNLRKTRVLSEESDTVIIVPGEILCVKVKRCFSAFLLTCKAFKMMFDVTREVLCMLEIPFSNMTRKPEVHCVSLQVSVIDTHEQQRQRNLPLIRSNEGLQQSKPTGEDNTLTWRDS